MKLKDFNQPAIWLLKVAIVTLLIIMSQSCAVQEELTVPDPNDRLIIGYEQGVIFKNRYYYKVVDGEGNPAPRVFIADTVVKPVYTVLICEY